MERIVLQYVQGITEICFFSGYGYMDFTDLQWSILLGYHLTNLLARRKLLLIL